MKNYYNWVILLLSFIIMFLCLDKILVQRHWKSKYNNVFNSYKDTISEIHTVKNHSQTLEQALENSEEENTKLMALVAELKDRPSEVKYITKVQTKLIPSDPIVVYTNLPTKHLFTLENGLLVARYENLEGQHVFETYELYLKTHVVTGEKSTSVLTEVASSAEPDTWYKTESDVDVVRIKENKHKVFEPHIGLGVVATAPGFNILPEVYLTLIHPNENLDVLGLSVAITKNEQALGVKPISWNAGSVLPIFTDLWLAPGVNVNTKGQFSGTLSLGTKF